MRQLLRYAIAALLTVSLAHSAAALDQNLAGTESRPTAHAYETLISRLDRAIGDHGLGVVARASATMGAKSIGVDIPGNMVVMVFHPRLAVRMLESSIPAGIEAPLRFYITENADGTASLHWKTASSVFAPYANEGIDEMARELDEILSGIAGQAVSN